MPAYYHGRAESDQIAAEKRMVYCCRENNGLTAIWKLARMAGGAWWR